MNFDFSDDVTAMREEVRRVLRDRFPRGAVRQSVDEGRRFDREFWAELGAMGWLGVAIPEDYGGSGLGYEALRQANPLLVYCAISGWGSEGSHADQPGFDSVFQAESGFASLTGDPDRPPMRTGSPVIDIAAAMNAWASAGCSVFLPSPYISMARAL